ncbi:MAG: arginine deiminase-related protein [Bacteroidia bacterium]
MQQTTSKQSLQTTDTIFMVRPAAFGFNPLAAESNAFMQETDELSGREISDKAKEEFDGMVAILQEAGIRVHVFEDEIVPYTPDAIFPNNWVSFHRSGRVILYPMEPENRRPERRMDIVEAVLGEENNAQIVDLSSFEEEDIFLEGTGSMIFDRINQVAYACISPRTDPQLFARFCMEMGIEGHLFHATGSDGRPVYHTNVMMALGTSLAVVCLDSIRDTEEQQELISSLLESDREIVEISMEQMNQFAGNMLEVQNAENKAFMVMSRRAHDSLRPEQLEAIRAHAQPLVIPIDVIETYGGGSVRCMIAEVFK